MDKKGLKEKKIFMSQTHLQKTANRSYKFNHETATFNRKIGSLLMYREENVQQKISGIWQAEQTIIDLISAKTSTEIIKQLHWS